MRVSPLVVASVFVVGCPSTSPSATSSGAMPSTSESARPLPPATSVAPAASSAPVREAPPPLASAKSLKIHRTQGGPSQMRCNGVTQETTFDLAASTWTNGLCLRNGSNDPLTTTKGKLTAAQRKEVDDAWSKLTVGPLTSCAKDAGAVTITITSSDGKAVAFTGDGGACHTQEGSMLFGTKDLLGAVNAIVLR